MTGEDMAEAFVKALPKILRIVAANPHAATSEASTAKAASGGSSHSQRDW